VAYNLYIHCVYVPKARSGCLAKPEAVLVPALDACFGPSIGLFLFGWAARSEVHWIIPTVGIVIYPGCVFILMQCVPLYTGMLPTLCSECVCCYRLYSQCIRVRCCHVLTAALRELGDWAGVQPFGWFD
jgi:hypothetical protein